MRDTFVTRRAFLGLLGAAAIVPLAVKLPSPAPVLGFTSGGILFAPFGEAVPQYVYAEQALALRAAVSDAIVDGFCQATMTAELLGPFLAEGIHA